MKDGWHVINGYNVYVEDGFIIRGVSHDQSKAVYVYRALKTGGYGKETKITPAAFRAGVKRGTIDMF